MNQANRVIFGDVRLDGVSWAGDATWFRLSPPGVAFDVGRGDLRLVGVEHLFVTHGHLDHALGLPFLLSHRTRHRGRPTRVYCPAEARGRFERFIAAAEDLEGATYEYELRGLTPDERVEIGKHHLVEPFSSSHVVDSLGFHLYRRVRRLAPDYEGRAEAELAALRREGITIEVESDLLVVSYCGDSGPEIFEREPRLFESRILVVECTFLDPGHVERARRYGHMHLEDLVVRRHRFENELIVLHHLSRRHTLAELRSRVERDLPELAERIEIVGAGDRPDGKEAASE